MKLRGPAVDLFYENDEAPARGVAKVLVEPQRRCGAGRGQGRGLGGARGAQHARALGRLAPQELKAGPRVGRQAQRDCERRQDFGPGFIALARSVYIQNDRRAAIKRRINDLTGSDIVEEKSYRPYQA
jgi:hypothetical protein